MIINIAIYENLKYFLEFFPNKNEEDFEEYNNPFYQAIIASSITQEEKTFRFCLINEKFKKFIEEYNLEDIPSALKTYMIGLSDEDVENLWKESIPSRNIELMLYPFMLIEENLEEKTNFNISKENIEKLSNLIIEKTNIDKKDIYIPGYIASFENLLNYGDSLISIGENYFYDNKLISYKMFEEQENNQGYNMYLYSIPIFIRKDIQSKVNGDFIKEMLEPQIPNYKLDSEKLKKVINIDKTIVPLTDTLVYVDDLPDIYDDICNLVNKETKKKSFFDKFNIFKNKKE